MSSLIREDILKIQAYIGGKPIDAVKRELGLKNIIKLASNENPCGCSKKVIKAIKDNLLIINRYPDGSCFYLKKALAKFLNINENLLLFGNGSDEIIDIIIKTFVSPNEEIITSDITFLEYKISSQANGRIIKTVPLKNYKYDLEAILNIVNERTKLIFIANPNNPTGTYLNRAEIKDFLKRLNKNIIVIFDEAYFEYIDVKDFPESLEYLNENVIILRTFSKIYGLAGLRVGFCIAKPEFIEVFNRVRQPFNVNVLAQVAACAALEDQGFVKKSRLVVLEGKEYLYCKFKQLNLEYIPSTANFILLKLQSSGKELCDKLLKEGIIIRDMDQYGLKNFVRVTIGKEKENKIFIKKLKEFI
ncbi:MAG: histidinol-phosphate transaminase [Candidatus Omnitrophota bacterium]